MIIYEIMIKKYPKLDQLLTQRSILFPQYKDNWFPKDKWAQSCAERTMIKGA